jgi:hypothetical protein
MRRLLVQLLRLLSGSDTFFRFYFSLRTFLRIFFLRQLLSGQAVKNLLLYCVNIRRRLYPMDKNVRIYSLFLIKPPYLSF